MKNLLSFFYLFIYFNNFGLNDLIEKILRDNPIVVKTLKSSHSFITIFDTSNLGSFVLKQKKVPDSIDWSALWMILSAQIASSIPNLLSQKVYVIPKEQDFIGKVYNNQLAILLTLVPGVMVKKSEKYKYLNLKQYKWQGKEKKMLGVTQKTIKHMSKHVDLPKIVALDIFLGYWDRHRKNFFYDEKNDRFWIIDMDTHRENLCGITYENFKNFLKDEAFYFLGEELISLIIFRDTLKLLVDTWKVDSLIDKIKNIAEEIGIKKNIYTFILKTSLIHNFVLINQMYNDAKKLLVITDQLIEKNKLFCKEEK